LQPWWVKKMILCVFPFTKTENPNSILLKPNSNILRLKFPRIVLFFCNIFSAGKGMMGMIDFQVMKSLIQFH
jgi:hypothetical protein